jgi:outer membrane phospholipase A
MNRRMRSVQRHGFRVLLLLLPMAVFAESATTQREHTSGIAGEWSPREDTEPALLINEPMYLVVGRDGEDIKARLQFSFKYRMLDTDGSIVKHASWLAPLHLGYTQTTLWNLSADSSPFEDSSYRPSLFLEFVNIERWGMPDLLRLGYEHESNGQDGEDSRSVDTLFVFPAWETQVAGRHLVAGVKVFAYLARGSETSDIENYRGYVDLIIRYGKEDSWLMTSMWRHGTENRLRVQIDLSYPIRNRFFAHSGGYFFIQTMHGYEESLITYDQRKHTVRLGFAIVR